MVSVREPDQRQAALPTAERLPVDLPSPSPACLAVIEALIGDDDRGHERSGRASNVDELVRRIGAEPMLAAELLRLANAANEPGQGETTTIKRAVFVLGIRTVRRVALQFAVRAAVADGRLPNELLGQFWRHALLRAACGELIARDVGIDADEAFLRGLLQDIGLLVLLHQQPEHASLWPLLAPLGPAERLAVEFEVFGETHVDIFHRLARAWNLPSVLTRPILDHHAAAADDDQHTVMGRVALAADAVVAHLAHAEGGSGTVDVRAALVGAGVAVNAVDERLGSIVKRAAQAADELGLSFEPAPSYEQVLRAALRLMLDVRVREQHSVKHLQRLLDEREQITEDLRRGQHDLSRMAYIDALTGLGNRRSFDETITQLVEQARAGGLPLSVLLIDLDHFKTVNDRYGHQGGDAVLMAVARTLTKQTRATDHHARIGGEELAVLLLGATATVAERIAEKIRVAVASLKVPHDGREISVTLSVGGRTCAPSGVDVDTATTVHHLIQAADAALYVAKKRGRNRVIWADVEET